MVSINEETKKRINKIASSYDIKVIYDPELNSTFQEEASRINRTIKIKENVEISDFNRLFEQIDDSYDVNRDQEMFIFNALHGIGHFALDLWKPKTDDELYNRMVNLTHDKKINKWAFEELLKLRLAKK